jgi:hypothetical protein
MQLVDMGDDFGRTGPSTEIEAQQLIGPFGRWAPKPQTDQQTGDHGHIHLDAAPVFALAEQVSAPQDAFKPTEKQLDVIVTTHKTIDLVFHTQVYKLKRDMTRQHAASASSVAFMHNDGMEVHDESPAHSPTADGGRPTPGGASPQGAHDHSGTPGGQ